MRMAEDHEKDRDPQFFAEYSLWNDSAYSIFSINPIAFTRPVDESVFLTPPKSENTTNEEKQVPPEQTKGSPGFERYMKRALKVVSRDDLLRDPADFKKDDDSDDSEPSSSSDKQEPAPDADMPRPARPGRRTAQQVNGRGRRMNLMQRRLEQALSQPARIERGASMMHRMGWDGGALGRDGVGIVEPIAPNAYYASSTAGFGLNSTDSAHDSAADSASETNQTKRSKTAKPQQKSKKLLKQEYKLNVLLYIREFVKNDLQIELFFEPKLKNVERKRIHEIVANLMGEQSTIEFESMEMIYLVRDIHRRNAYTLGTQSEGAPPNRHICIYKEAPETMYLVTPDDIRAPILEPDNEEETNPFLKSITRHMKTDSDTPAEKEEPSVLDRIIDYFVEFSEQEYKEFRFLGPFNIEEVDAMNSFFGMVSSLSEGRRGVPCPERLLKVFDDSAGVIFTTDEDVNGFVSVKKAKKTTGTKS